MSLAIEEGTKKEHFLISTSLQCSCTLHVNKLLVTELSLLITIIHWSYRSR